MPANVHSDHLTGMGFLGATAVLAGGLLSHYGRYFLLIMIAGIVLNWLGDSLDGTLARHRNQERPKYGYFVDHGCDLFAIILIGLGFGLSPFMSPITAAIGVIGYLTFMVCALLRQHARGVLQIAYVGVGPTEIRIFIILITLSYLLWPPHLIVMGEWRIYIREAFILSIVAIEIILLFFFMLTEARSLAIEDPLKSGSAEYGSDAKILMSGRQRLTVIAEKADDPGEKKPTRSNLRGRAL